MSRDDVKMGSDDHVNRRMGVFLGYCDDDYGYLVTRVTRVTLMMMMTTRVRNGRRGRCIFLTELREVQVQICSIFVADKRVSLNEVW